MFGVLPSKIAITPYTDDTMAALFGPKRLSIPRHGFHDLSVLMVSLTFQAGRRSPPETSKAREEVFKVKRDEVWNNGHRNRWIAGLTRAISAEDDQALAAKYPPVAQELYSRLGGRVGVLVENVEHAAKILNRLPGWPIVADPAALDHPLPAKVQTAIVAGHQQEHATTEDVIVTHAGMMSAGVFDILIRADAGTGLPPISDAFYVASDGTGQRLLLIDVADKHHPHLRQRSGWRKQASLERGWTVEGERLFASPDERCGPSAGDRGTVFRIGYLSAPSNANSSSAATRAYERREERRKQKQRQKGNVITLTQVAHPDYLYECLQHLRQHGGPAPGLDGIGYGDLSPSEWGEIVQRISKALLRFTYRPQPTRKAPIPKPGTSERRLLSLGSTCDRIVSLAIHRTLEPHLDPLFLPGSWGFRSGRGVWQMLAHLKRTMEETGRWVLGIDDVRKAFDNVPIDKLLEAMQKAQADLKDEEYSLKISNAVLKLIAVLAKGTAQTRTVGIDQGNNISPTELNVLLHYIHDQPLTATVSFPFWYRYADNLTYLCQSVSEGQQMLDRVKKHLRKSGLRLKGKDGVTDLRRNPATLLGFTLREQNGALTLSAGQPAWEHLEEHLRKAHEANDPLRMAEQVVTGWINFLGPAFEDGKPVVTQLCCLLTRYGFGEMSRDWIETQVTEAWGRWEEMVEA